MLIIRMLIIRKPQNSIGNHLGPYIKSRPWILRGLPGDMLTHVNTGFLSRKTLQRKTSDLERSPYGQEDHQQGAERHRTERRRSLLLLFRCISLLEAAVTDGAKSHTKAQYKNIADCK